MSDLKMPHVGHEGHLCYLKNLGLLMDHLSEYKKLVQNAAYICKNCGRAAKLPQNLCNPEKL